MQNNKLKILLCSPTEKVGGISSWTKHILSYYNENRDTLKVCVKQYYCSDGSNEVDAMSFIKRCVTGFAVYYRMYKGVCKLVKVTQFDVLHLCSSASISLTKDIILLRAAKKKNIKTVIHFHFGRIPELYQKKNWEQKLLHKVIKLADKVIVIDKMSYDTLIREGYNNIKNLPNPIAPEILKVISQNVNIQRIERKVIFVGYVVPTKGVYELIEACKQIPDIKLKVIGAVSDNMRQQLLALIGNDICCTITGVLDMENVIREMLSASVFVLPTYTEGFPNVILESMTCACPVVASSVGAIPEMLNMEDVGENKRCGICIKPRNIAELKNAIEFMLSDKDMALQYGINAQKRVIEKYSMPVVWQQLENIWILNGGEKPDFVYL